MRTTIMAAAMLCVLSGCDQESIRAYRAPKNPEMAETAPATPGLGVTWTVPKVWVSAPGNEPMRLATFKTGEGLPDVLLSAFPGDAGGLLANVNRWRGQIGLEPIEAAQLPLTMTTVEVQGVSVAIVQITGTGDRAILGAAVSPGDGNTWFAKALGKPEAITALRPSFEEFARSFRHQGADTAPRSGNGSGEVQARLAVWKPPANWSVDTGASSIVAAAYQGANASGGAKVTVTMLHSGGGGTLANINRWRDQMGLPAVEQIAQQPIADLGGGCLLVDLSAPDGSRRMMAAIVLSGDQTWFFKISGSPAGVEAERAAYEGLVHSVGLGQGTP